MTAGRRLTTRALAQVRDEALQVARAWSGPDAPSTWDLTASIFTGLADDSELLALAAAIRPERLPPLLFAASVQYVVERHREHPFAAYFPEPGSDQPALDDSFAGHYRSFCRQYGDELVDLQGRRHYQMNEVARCAQVALAVGALTHLQPERDLALVDVGAGSGLGLFLDRYRYGLSDGRHWGTADSAVAIDCELRGRLRPRLPQVPVIGHRVGIDLNPIDLDDPEERAWLAACAPPEVGALRRLAGAVDVVRAGRAPVLAGAADTVLPDVLAAIPAGQLVVVVDSYTAVFFTDDQLARVSEAIARFGDERDVAWISLDPLVPLGTQARRAVQGVEMPDRLVEQNRRGGVFAALSLTTYARGQASAALLATAHPSGTRMEWIDPTSSI